MFDRVYNMELDYGNLEFKSPYKKIDRSKPFKLTGHYFEMIYDIKISEKTRLEAMRKAVELELIQKGCTDIKWTKIREGKSIKKDLENYKDDSKFYNWSIRIMLLFAFVFIILSLIFNDGIVLLILGVTIGFCGLLVIYLGKIPNYKEKEKLKQMVQDEPRYMKLIQERFKELVGELNDEQEAEQARFERYIREREKI